MFFGGLTIAINGFSMVFDFVTIAFNGFRLFRTIGVNGFSMVFKVLRAMVNDGFEVNDCLDVPLQRTF